MLLANVSAKFASLVSRTSSHVHHVTRSQQKIQIVNKRYFWGKSASEKKKDEIATVINQTKRTPEEWALLYIQNEHNRSKQPRLTKKQQEMFDSIGHAIEALPESERLEISKIVQKTQNKQHEVIEGDYGFDEGLGQFYRKNETTEPKAARQKASTEAKARREELAKQEAADEKELAQYYQDKQAGKFQGIDKSKLESLKSSGKISEVAYFMETHPELQAVERKGRFMVKDLAKEKQKITLRDLDPTPPPAAPPRSSEHPTVLPSAFPNTMVLIPNIIARATAYAAKFGAPQSVPIDIPVLPDDESLVASIHSPSHRVSSPDQASSSSSSDVAQSANNLPTYNKELVPGTNVVVPLTQGLDTRQAQYVLLDWALKTLPQEEVHQVVMETFEPLFSLEQEHEIHDLLFRYANRHELSRFILGQESQHQTRLDEVNANPDLPKMKDYADVYAAELVQSYLKIYPQRKGEEAALTEKISTHIAQLAANKKVENWTEWNLRLESLPDDQKAQLDMLAAPLKRLRSTGAHINKHSTKPSMNKVSEAEYQNTMYLDTAEDKEIMHESYELLGSALDGFALQEKFKVYDKLIMVMKQLELIDRAAIAMNRDPSQITAEEVAQHFYNEREAFVSKVELDQTPLFSASESLKHMNASLQRLRNIYPRGEFPDYMEKHFDQALLILEDDAKDELVMEIPVSQVVYEGVKENLFPTFAPAGITTQEMIRFMGGPEAFIDPLTFQLRNVIQNIQAMPDELGEDEPNTAKYLAVLRLEREVAKYIRSNQDGSSKAIYGDAQARHAARQAMSHKAMLRRLVTEGDITPEARFRSEALPNDHPILDPNPTMYIHGDVTNLPDVMAKVDKDELPTVNFTVRDHFNPPTHFRPLETADIDAFPGFRERLQLEALNFPVWEGSETLLAKDAAELSIRDRLYKLFNYFYPSVGVDENLQELFMEQYDVSPGEPTLEWVLSFPPPHHTFVPELPLWMQVFELDELYPAVQWPFYTPMAVQGMAEVSTHGSGDYAIKFVRTKEELQSEAILHHIYSNIPEAARHYLTNADVATVWRAIMATPGKTQALADEWTALSATQREEARLTWKDPESKMRSTIFREVPVIPARSDVEKYVSELAHKINPTFKDPLL